MIGVPEFRSRKASGIANENRVIAVEGVGREFHTTIPVAAARRTATTTKTANMADADFLVLPSVTVEEMFGLVVLEAMAAGRPVITTALPSAVREVNVPGVTGLEVPLRDVPALAQALESLSRDAARRRTMGEAGRRRVNERFTQSVMAERHIELYQRLRAGKG